MLTRRQFLCTGAAVLAAVAGCGRGLPLQPQVEVDQKGSQSSSSPFRVALLSDTHIREDGRPSSGFVEKKLVDALDDFRQFRPDFWIVNGDISDHGYPQEFAAFQRIMLKVAKPSQLMVAVGNHEFYDRRASDEEALTRFKQAFGLVNPYSNRVLAGVHVVVLADEQWKTAPRNPDWAWLTPAQLQWFERVLREHRHRLTVVFLHQPLQDTVLRSHGNNSFGGSGQVQELRAILRRNRQVKLWFSGHTHRRIEAPGQTVKQGGVIFAALGSTFYQFTAPEGGKKDFKASQSRMMEVWSDRILVRVRDHGEQRWIPHQDLVIPRL